MQSLGWKPNRLSQVPLHQQIENYLKEKILHGEWTVGTKIPSQRALAEAFEVNRSTVITALDELMATGLIAGKSGGGTKVINTTWNLLASTPPPDWHTYVKTGIHRPNKPTIQTINQAEFYSDAMRLGTGELSPELLPRKQTKAIMQWLADQVIPLGYEEAKGNLLLRQQLVKYLKELGIHTSPSSILIVSGALQALQLISIGLLHRGSTVLMENPSYLHSLHVLQSIDMRLVGVPMDNRGIQISAIEKYKRQYNGALLYTIPSFHNPTGTLMTEDRRQDVMELCEQLSLPLIEDDVYRDLWFESPPPKPLKASDKNGMVLYLGSMSKSVSPGLRIGWIAGPEPVINRLADIKMQTDYGSSSISQSVAAEWFSTGLYREHLKDIREQLRTRRDAVIQMLKKHFEDIASWEVPKGGFYIWVRIIPSLPMHELFSKALKKGILLNPGYIYGQENSQYLRISYSYASVSEIKKGIAQLAVLVKQLSNMQ